MESTANYRRRIPGPDGLTYVTKTRLDQATLPFLNLTVQIVTVDVLCNELKQIPIQCLLAEDAVHKGTACKHPVEDRDPELSSFRE